MITVEIQIHGYRKGHQLLASSNVLSKDDQAVVDRLSDVAGPLRPKEQFAPYLSAYPLPSGAYYVVARTWQDLTVPRAGCVRTKSVLIDAHLWCQSPPLAPVLMLLSSTELPTEQEAIRIELEERLEVPFPPTPSFAASELLEALFLEDAKPVVVFDAPDQELIALRLLTALWPDIRRRFALSTFALSPRKLGGRDLDLVFAPTNAKAKFSDWNGRRVDGRSSQNDRHRWTGTIVRRAFEDAVPRLLSVEEISFLSDREADSASALRVALLWDELIEKLDRTPTAVLGLLDIANSGMVNSTTARVALEPRLIEVTRNVVSQLTLGDAWEFVGAIARKMKGYDMPNGRAAVKDLTIDLAQRNPEGAIGLLLQPDPKGVIDDLIPSIATGLGNGDPRHVERALMNSPPEVIVRLVAQGGTLTRRVAENSQLIEKLGVVLAEVNQNLATSAGTSLLPYLVEDRHAVAALPIFARLDSLEVVEALRRLDDVNHFQSGQLCAMLIDRAHEVGGISGVRDVLLSSKIVERVYELLASTVTPTRDDVLWLLNDERLSGSTSSELLVRVLRGSNDQQLAALCSDRNVEERIIQHLTAQSADVLAKAVLRDILPANIHIPLIRSVISMIDNALKLEIAGHVLSRCLGGSLDTVDIGFIVLLFDILGIELDGARVASMGIGHGINHDVASRNLVAFEKASAAARARIVAVVDEIAYVLLGRPYFDLTEEAYNAFARLLLDAEKSSPKALASAAGLLIPSLSRATRQPVSLLIAVLFPVVYKELAKESDIPDILKLIPFVEWDRCKIARQDLVRAFMSSSWNPGDLALTAIRCLDLRTIINDVASSYGGENYLRRIEKDLDRTDIGSRHFIQQEIADIRLNR